MVKSILWTLKAFYKSPFYQDDRKKAWFWLIKRAAWRKTLWNKMAENSLTSVLDKNGHLLYAFRRVTDYLVVANYQELLQTRAECLIDEISVHYVQLNAYYDARKLEKIGSSLEGVRIANLPVKNGSEIELRLQFIQQFRREGLTTFAAYFNKKPIYYLTFTIKNDGLYIASVQGAKDNVSSSKQFTSDTPGRLMPQVYIYYALNLFAEIIGVKAIYGVKHLSHVLQREQKNHFKLEYFDYDAYWAQFKATDFNNDWWQLSVPFIKTELDSVSSKKRAKLKARYQLLDSTRDALADYMDKGS